MTRLLSAASRAGLAAVLFLLALALLRLGPVHAEARGPGGLPATVADARGAVGSLPPAPVDLIADDLRGLGLTGGARRGTTRAYFHSPWRTKGAQ